MDGGTEQAGSGRRVAAGAVDASALLGAAAVLALLVEPLTSLTEAGPSAAAVALQAVAVLAVVAVPLAVLVALEARLGTSPGKALLGLRVATGEGARPGLRRSLARTAYRCSPVGIAGAAYAVATRRGPLWHDDWTGTTVRSRRPRARPVSERVTGLGARPVDGARPVHGARRTGGPGPARGAQQAAATAPAPEARSQRPRRDAPGEARGRADVSRPAGPPRPAAPAGRRSAGDEAVVCRCREETSFEGDAAVAYASGHLRVVRRHPARGELVLVCPLTRVVWFAREPWAAPGGTTSLERQGTADGERADRDAPAATPRA